MSRFETHSFIEYGSARDAEDAVRKLDGTDLMGSIVTVTADVCPSSSRLVSVLPAHC